MATGAIEKAASAKFDMYDSVADLGLTVGSATISQAWNAMAGKDAVLMCNATDFASSSIPSTAGNIMMYRLAAYSQRGIIRYFSRVPGSDYAMGVDTNGNADGTWVPLPVGQQAQLSQNGTATFTMTGNMGVLFYGRGTEKYAAIMTFWDSAPLVITSSGTAPVITKSTNSSTFTVKNTVSGSHVAMFLTVPTTYF